jgi:hypothetical protein
MNFLHSGHDSRIRSTAADIAAHALANFIGTQVSRADFPQIGGDVAGVAALGFLQERDGGADLPRRAVAALKSIVLQERGLYGMQLIALRQSFYCCNLLAFMRHSQRETTVDAAAVGKHGACATLAVIATFFCAGEMQLLAQKIEERGARIQRELVLFSIDGQLQRHRASIVGGPFDFRHSGSAAVNGESHDNASGKKAGGGNKLPPGYGPAIDWAVLLLRLVIYSLGIYNLGVWGFVIHPASLRGKKAAAIPRKFRCKGHQRR